VLEQPLDHQAAPDDGAGPQTPSGPILALVEAALLLDIVVVLCLIRTFVPIPFFQGLVRLFCPTPFVLLGLRQGVRTTVIASVGSYVVLSALVGPLFGIQILVYGLLGAAYAGAARARLHYTVAVLFGSIIYGIYVAFLTVGIPLFLGIINLHVSASKLLNEIRQGLMQFGHGIGSLHFGPIAPHEWVGLRNLYHWMLQHWIAALLFIVIFNGLLNGWLFLYITREILARIDRGIRVDARGNRIDFYPPPGI
jgi:hypothetical protein